MGMRNLIYVFVFGVIGLFAGCHDVTIGYLVVDETAGYAVDTMRIIANAENELQRLKEVMADFERINQPLVEELEKKSAELAALRALEAEETNKRMAELDNMFDNGLITGDEYMERYNAINDEMWEKYGVKGEEIALEMWNIEDEMEVAAEEMGIGSVALLQSQINQWQQTVDFRLPWTTPSIEGVLGTAPIVYKVINVKSNHPENAAKFMDCVTVRGEGAICVDFDPDVPVGTYTVTLEIKNEGRTRIVEDVYTFVIYDTAGK